MSTSKTRDFTEGKILQPLLLFALPVLLALFLQAMYGAVDLMVVGKFGDAADISGVSTGSQITTPASSGGLHVPYKGRMLAAPKRGS